MEYDLVVSYQKANNTGSGDLLECFIIIHVVIAQIDMIRFAFPPQPVGYFPGAEMRKLIVRLLGAKLVFRNHPKSSLHSMPANNAMANYVQLETLPHYAIKEHPHCSVKVELESLSFRQTGPRVGTLLSRARRTRTVAKGYKQQVARFR